MTQSRGIEAAERPPEVRAGPLLPLPHGKPPQPVWGYLSSAPRNNWCQSEQQRPLPPPSPAPTRPSTNSFAGPQDTYLAWQVPLSPWQQQALPPVS